MSSSKYIVLSASLREGSRSRILAQGALDRLKSAGVEVEWIDLVDNPLPQCDGGACYGDARVHEFKAKMEAAQGYLLATPIYNYDVNAALKNVIELTGRDVWTEKVVGFLCAAGGQGSYMAVSSVAASLMLDFHTFILPRFVYATGEDFDEQDQTSETVGERLDGICSELVRVTEALKGD